MNWSRVDYLWIVVIFLNVRTLIQCRGSTGEQVMLNFSISVLMKQYLGWPEGQYIFCKFSFFGELFV